jgi:hypothetical protein
MNTFIGWLENHEMTCFFKSLAGIDCPGCGTQRAFIFLLKGDLMQSFQTYPPLLPLFFLFGFLSLHLIFRFRSGGVYLKYLFISTVSVVILNFILRLIHHT